MPIPDEIIREVRDLEPLPMTVQQLLTVLGDENVPLGDIAKIIEYDEALVANTLRLANSAYYSRGREVQTARAAVVRLGTSAMLNMALGQYLRSMTVPATMYDLNENDLWLHSAVSSLATGEIIRRSHVQIPQVANVAALVHDIGKLIMVRYFKVDFSEVLNLCEESGLTFVEAERELFGCDHAEVGGTIAEKWNFPPEVREAISRHHDEDLEDSSPVLDTVVMANLAAKTLGIGLGAEGLNLRIDDRCGQRLGINVDTFCAICADLQDQVDELKKMNGFHNKR